jgi:hypothetical protein
VVPEIVKFHPKTEFSTEFAGGPGEGLTLAHEQKN